MEIRSQTRLHHPIHRVFAAYRDQMPEVAPCIPDVKSCRVVSREESRDTVALHKEWISGREVPAILSKIIKPEHLYWEEHALWSTSTLTCGWKISTRAFADAVDCQGTTSLTEDAEGTVVRLHGDLHIDLKEVPGVPGFLGKRLATQVEKFIVGLISPNFEKANSAIGAFLDARS